MSDEVKHREPGNECWRNLGNMSKDNRYNLGFNKDRNPSAVICLQYML